MRVAMLAATVLAVGLAIGAFLVVQVGGTGYIKNTYISEEKKLEREAEYAKELQKYVIDNKISSEDVALLAEWAQSNRYLYVMIHKDDKLLFETGKYDDETKNPDTSQPNGDKNDDLPDDDDLDGAGDDTEIDDGTIDPDAGEEDDSIGSGITVDMPSREELMKYAREKGAHLITVSDGSVLVSMADFSEYFYYDLTNIAAMITAVTVLLAVVLLYSHGVTRRISLIARDVSLVAEGDMDHRIESDGKDELGRLSRDVESMRSAMLDNVKKEREAMDANAELVTSMSHDIRTPLTVLLGYLDIMKLHSADDEEMTSYITASEKTALRLKKMSDDMFNYFLLFGGGAAEVDMQEYDAYTLFDQMLSEHVLLLREQGYDVTINVIDIRPARLTVRTDANLLKRIIENVISNVLKYADVGRPVVIDGTVEGDLLRLSVTNGIPNGPTNAESNGIGLRTCRKLASEMGAEITTGDDGDTYTFVLTVPVNEEREKK